MEKLDEELETCTERLAKATVEERFALSNSRQCFNLADYNRDDIDKEIEIWKFDRYYPINGLRGGTDELIFSNEARTQCKLIMEAGYAFRSQSIVLKEIFIHDGIITLTTTYNDLNGNHTLKKGLFDLLVGGLSDKPNNSKYGCAMVSDFDLCCNLQPDKAFNTKMKELNVSNLTESYDRLRKNRSKIRKFMSKMVQTVIDCFELPEMPDKEGESAKKKAKTKEDVAKSAQEKFSQVAKDTQKKQREATEPMDLTVEADKESPNNLDLTNPKLIEMDNNEPDELDNVPDSQKTKEGYLKEGFVVDDNHVMDEKQKRRLHAPFRSQLRDGKDTPPSSPPKDKKAYSDDCSTPDSITQVLVDNYLKANYRPTTKIWEIACGSEQKIVKCLQTAGFTNVTYSDIQGEAIGVTKHDFLEEGQGLYPDHEYDLIITNPPWSQSKAFLQKAIELGKSNPQLLVGNSTNFFLEKN
jgi:hypothetical protein